MKSTGRGFFVLMEYHRSAEGQSCSTYFRVRANEMAAMSVDRISRSPDWGYLLR